MADTKSDSVSANSLLTRFKFTKLLNTDQQNRRMILQGTISGEPALLLAERAAFATEDSYLISFSRLLSHVNNLGENDIYRWYMAHSMTEDSVDAPTPPDLKINLIYPCTDKHIRKYSPQKARVVVETPKIYRSYVKPYMKACREEGRLNWVFNILDGKAEQENVLFRSKDSLSLQQILPSGADSWLTMYTGRDRANMDFILTPDLNWDQKTLESMHLLAIVERRDIWSIRDLRPNHAAWLLHLRKTLTSATTRLYPSIEPDMLKFYVHYQPTYYHFHIHIVHVATEATGTQAVGKALGLDTVISMLDLLNTDPGSPPYPSMARVELSYTLGENSELWQKIFLPLKEGRTPEVGEEIDDYPDGPGSDYDEYSG